MTLNPQWQVISSPEMPQEFFEDIKPYLSEEQGKITAQLLWQRGIKDPQELSGFLNADAYTPSSAFAFGQEMKWAIERLKRAYNNQEKVTIWGDFDADGITATSVLWEGLGEFFAQYLQLNYYIPHRFNENHGLNCAGIEQLATDRTHLIITCDTGSTNLKEIECANQLGIDIIITDHHTLPIDRPPVISIINPRYFSESHPLYHLSGVAVAYKLIEALYETLPEVPKNPLENLLDLVAIGLIADLVQLSGDCRYLAQKGIERLKQQQNSENPTHPGVVEILKLCKKSGDRPMDISFGIGPRINAVSRIQGDASFCVDLLTSKDREHCKKLAIDTELANTRRKSLQKDITENVKKKLEAVDLCTTSVIVLEDSQWQSGVLGLVAGRIAQEYGRPTILLTTGEQDTLSSSPLARGSARSMNNIDLYQLVASQSHLLHRFGGHPFAAGLSLPVENLPLFREGINQQLKQHYGQLNGSVITADLIVTVSQLGKSLFRELNALEPYGMGNPIPRLLMKNCWFTEVWNKNDQDIKGKPVKYIKTRFKIWDNSVDEGFPGVWWEHYGDEIPKNTPCDVIVELDYNTHNEKKDKDCYEVRLIAIRPSVSESPINAILSHEERLIDWRNLEIRSLVLSSNQYPEDIKLLTKCPATWEEIQREYRRAIAEQEKLALAYGFSTNFSGQETWTKLVGIAKYIARQGHPVTIKQLREKLDLSYAMIKLGLRTLSYAGFNYRQHRDEIFLERVPTIHPELDHFVHQFIEAVEEEHFQRKYFYKVPLPTLQNILDENIINRDTFDF